MSMESKMSMILPKFSLKENFLTVALKHTMMRGKKLLPWIFNLKPRLGLRWVSRVSVHNAI